MQKRVTIIGAGIAGLEAADLLTNRGYSVTVVEQSSAIGGNVRNWDRLFPNQRRASQVLEPIIAKYNRHSQVTLHTDSTITAYHSHNRTHTLTLSTGKKVEADAILICTGFQVFDAHRKEEYGYGIYDNVITSADLEKTMANGRQVLTVQGEIPKRVAFVHCVGSRDEKVGNTYCSKVCCVTAVKQAIELKEMYPDSEAFCLYMDLRMYDRYFEDLYREAQEQHNVNFVRGRLSEVAEGFDGRLQIKTEDTLLGKPLKLSVDMLVLMTGMESCGQASELGSMLGVARGNDGFFTPASEHTDFNLSGKEGVFLAGTCKGPKNIAETIADARSAANAICTYLTL